MSFIRSASGWPIPPAAPRTATFLSGVDSDEKDLIALPAPLLRADLRRIEVMFGYVQEDRGVVSERDAADGDGRLENRSEQIVGMARTEEFIGVKCKDCGAPDTECVTDTWARKP